GVKFGSHLIQVKASLQQARCALRTGLSFARMECGLPRLAPSVVNASRSKTPWKSPILTVKRGETHDQACLSAVAGSRVDVRMRRLCAGCDHGHGREQGHSEIPERDVRATVAEPWQAGFAGGAAGGRLSEERSADAAAVLQPDRRSGHEQDVRMRDDSVTVS